MDNPLMYNKIRATSKLRRFMVDQGIESSKIKYERNNVLNSRFLGFLFKRDGLDFVMGIDYALISN